MSIAVQSEVANIEKATLEHLAASLAETAVETIKAQNYHWNVTGPAFGPLHDLFQKIYEDHFEAQDTLAERIKALGGHADGRYSHFLELSAITECEGNITHRQMLQNLAADQQMLSSTLLTLARVAEDRGDAVTNDIAIERADVHDKFAWMLRAHLSD